MKTRPRGALIISQMCRVANHMRDVLWDYDVKTAWMRSAVQAEAFAKRHRVEIAVVDLEIDDGNEVIQFLENTVPKLRIFALTSYPNLPSAYAAIASGAEKVIDYSASGKDIASSLGVVPFENAGSRAEFAQLIESSERMMIDRVLAECG